jgi:hypothetical protein
MPARAVPRDNQVDRSLRLFGSNVGIADGVTVYDHRAANSTTETTLLWIYSVTRHIVPPTELQMQTRVMSRSPSM